MKRLFLTIIFLLFTSFACAGTAYYVDLNAGGSNSGTYANPWNSIATVNAYNFSTGDDVYFKVSGSTHTMSTGLVVDWSGTSGDHAVIGCYDGNGDFDCGSSRATLDGDAICTYPSYCNVLKPYNVSYVDIEDIRINYSGDVGIKIDNSDHFTVDNCYIYRTKRHGILVYRSPYGTVSHNIVEQAEYLTSPGAGIEISSGFSTTADVGATHDITVSYNKVFHCYEGIGTYKFATDTTIEYNEVYDNRSYMIYPAATKRTIVRYNLVYNSVDYANWTYQSRRRYLIVGDVEDSVNRDWDWEDNEIYGNLIAAGKVGILLDLNEKVYSCTCKNNKIYNNTIVDCQTNFSFSDDDARWSGNIIKNNISWTLTENDSFHTNKCSPSGVTWDYNLWDEDPGSGNCDAVNDPANSSPLLSTSSGWRSLTAGGVDGSEFESLVNSPAINVGLAIAGYNDRISACDFTASPITVTITADATTPDIGAWMFGAENDVPDPDPMTFATNPAGFSTTSVNMTGTTCSDNTPPISYNFDFDPDSDNCGNDADIGTGGTDSGWQSADTTYTDSGLQVNQVYCYTAQARDNVGTPNVNTTSASVKAYTLAATPGALTVGNAADTTIDITANAENGNPSSNPTTTFAVKCTYTSPSDTAWINKWVQADGSAGASEAWMSDATIDGTITVTGLNKGTAYKFASKSKNGDSVETALGTEAEITTTGAAAPPPTAGMVGGIWQ